MEPWSTIISIGIGLISTGIALVSLRLASRKDTREEAAEITALKIEIAVIKERLSTEINLLQKVADKVDDIVKEIK